MSWFVMRRGHLRSVRSLIGFFGSERDAQNGFTLIETLVAASIFASITLVGVATFTKMNQLNDRARQHRVLSEAGRFVVDDMVRAMSNATGSTCRQSLEIQNSLGLPASAATGKIVEGPKLFLRTTDANGALVERQYFQDGNTLKLWKKVGVATATVEPVTGSEVEVVTMKFRGVSATVATKSQPFTQLELTLRTTDNRSGKPATQTFRTSVSSRDYQFATRTKPVATCEAAL